MKNLFPSVDVPTGGVSTKWKEDEIKQNTIKMEAALFSSETIKGSRTREDNLIESRFPTADFHCFGKRKDACIRS